MCTGACVRSFFHFLGGKSTRHEFTTYGMLISKNHLVVSLCLSHSCAHVCVCAVLCAHTFDQLKLCFPGKRTKFVYLQRMYSVVVHVTLHLIFSTASCIFFSISNELRFFHSLDVCFLYRFCGSHSISSTHTHNQIKFQHSSWTLEIGHSNVPRCAQEGKKIDFNSFFSLSLISMCIFRFKWMKKSFNSCQRHKHEICGVCMYVYGVGCALSIFVIFVSALFGHFVISLSSSSHTHTWISNKKVEEKMVEKFSACRTCSARQTTARRKKQ